MTDTTSLKSEILSGLNETSKYLLSHHEVSEYYKCLELEHDGKKHYLCARCFGIYTGLIIGFLYYNYISDSHLSYALISILPMPAIIDWSISAFEINRSKNLFRIISGFLLGIAYLNGILLLFRNFPDYTILAIGIFYVSLALLLLFLKKKLIESTNCDIC
ncbi:DUF2085 domain-containing protein [Methanolobus sediminis]|uniref:DUF2085 domain-containing protein n=1 Tax=Methanolobus sediminis TaxID=3072978 RepID=A0AA51UIP5_9EURY|nr:DUF2085 domain-containing protein [Methanolobus sediminis]WMW24002.1 DUF2085 domain-containing protein [Methanolobus sediminis]